jgi:Leucine-rich repeat (LRR) protein
LNLPKLQVLDLKGNPIDQIPANLCADQEPYLHILEADEQACAKSQNNCCSNNHHQASNQKSDIVAFGCIKSIPK